MAIDIQTLRSSVGRVQDTGERLMALIELINDGDPSTHTHSFEDEFELAYGAVMDAIGTLSDAAQAVHTLHSRNQVLFFFERLFGETPATRAQDEIYQRFKDEGDAS